MNPLRSRSLRAALSRRARVCLGGCTSVCISLCISSAALVASPAQAQTTPVIGATSVIANGAGTSVNGALTVNQTAGLNNAQANQITLSKTGPSGAAGMAINANTSLQTATVTTNVTSAQASIDGNAFSNSSGAVLVNQSAGAANLQRNSTLLGTGALGVENVADAELSAAVPRNGGRGVSIGVQGAREANISTDAFKNVSGIVQINQAAGAGNATANSFVLRPPAGTFFN